MTETANPAALIAGAFGSTPELLARELRALGARPAFIERLPAPGEAAALFFFCGADVGPRLGPRLAAASAAALAARVKRVCLVRFSPPSPHGLAAEEALRGLCARSGADLKIVDVHPGAVGDDFARGLATLAVAA